MQGVVGLRPGVDKRRIAFSENTNQERGKRITLLIGLCKFDYNFSSIASIIQNPNCPFAKFTDKITQWRRLRTATHPSHLHSDKDGFELQSRTWMLCPGCKCVHTPWHKCYVKSFPASAKGPPGTNEMRQLHG